MLFIFYIKYLGQNFVGIFHIGGVERSEWRATSLIDEW